MYRSRITSYSEDTKVAYKCYNVRLTEAVNRLGDMENVAPFLSNIRDVYFANN